MLYEVITHYIFYKVGAIDEQSGKTGLAHMTEHMMFKGTNKVKPDRITSYNVCYTKLLRYC